MTPYRPFLEAPKPDMTLGILIVMAFLSMAVANVLAIAWVLGSG